MSSSIDLEFGGSGSAKKQQIQLECQICFDETVSFVRINTNNTSECTHIYCNKCIVSWIHEQIIDFNKVIKCPHPDCKYQLSNDDIKSFASPRFYKKYSEYMKEEYESNLQEILSQNSAFSEWMKDNARSCPKCKVLITKDENSCNSMKCNCGQSFCFCCGQEHCEKLKVQLISRYEAHTKLAAFQQNSLYQIMAQIGYLKPSESIDVMIKYNNLINLQNTHFHNLFHNKEQSTKEEFDVYVMQGHNYDVYVKMVQQGKIKPSVENKFMDLSNPLLKPVFLAFKIETENQRKANISFEPNMSPLHSLIKHIGTLNIKKKIKIDELKQHQNLS
jgi:hypothetical protein